LLLNLALVAPDLLDLALELGDLCLLRLGVLCRFGFGLFGLFERRLCPQ